MCVVPAYNEASNIGGVIQDVRTHVPGADVLVVDDGSADETAWEAGRSGAIVCRLPFNLGYGAALQTGYKYAAGNRYEYVVQIDGDGQHKAEYIPQMLECLEAEDVDLVIGSRFLGQQGYRVPLLRRIGIGVFRTIASILTGRRISDPTSGYQAFNRKVLDILVTDAYPWDYPDADVIIMLHRAGVRIAEIPVQMRPAPGQQSMHSGLKPIYYVFKMLLSIFVTLVRAAPTRARDSSEAPASVEGTAAVSARCPKRAWRSRRGAYVCVVSARDSSRLGSASGRALAVSCDSGHAGGETCD